MDFEKNVRDLAASIVTEPSHFIVHVGVSSLQGPRKVTVVLDGDNGVSIDDCAALSRQLSNAMEEKGMIGDNFTLEVTTPGVDKPLQLQRQYVRNIGRGLKIHLNDKSVISGKLISADMEGISVEVEHGEVKKKEIRTVGIPFGNIEKAYVQVSFK